MEGLITCNCEIG